MSKEDILVFGLAGPVLLDLYRPDLGFFITARRRPSFGAGACAVRSTSSVGMPQVPLRTVSNPRPWFAAGRARPTPRPPALRKAGSRGVDIGDTPAQPPEPIVLPVRRAILSWPVHDFDREIAAAKEHQPSPIGDGCDPTPCRGQALHHKARRRSQRPRVAITT